MILIDLSMCFSLYLLYSIILTEYLISNMQNTIQFPIRKKCNFYGKSDVVKENFSDARARCTPVKYTPVVKKIVTLSSSESDSDSENVLEKQESVINEGKVGSKANSPRRRKCDKSDGK